MKQSITIILVFFILNSSCTYVTVAIVGTNDIHGAAFPTIMYRQDTGQRYQYGGLPVMAQMIQIIRSQNPGNTLYLDAGDQFQGGIQSSKLISSGKIMNDFFDLSEVNDQAIGNHQFDFGPEFLFPYMSSKDSNILAANLRSEKGQKDFLPRQTSSQMHQFANGVKIGVIGLSTVETPSTTSGFQKALFPPYKFLQYKQIVLQQSAKLKKSGANAVLIVSHVGNACSANFDYGFWDSTTDQSSCAQDDQLTSLIEALPKNTIHGVVQGHRHTTSHVFIQGIPVIGNINGGYYFNVMYLTFNSKNQYEYVDGVIQGPIPVCLKIFQKTGKCNYMESDETAKAGPLVQWYFHNKKVTPEPRLQTIYQQQWYPKMQSYLVELVQNEIHLKSQYNQECELANLINDLIWKNFTFADFTVLNMGGFRTEWIPGILLEQHLFNMFPFDNVLESFNISGKQMLDSFKIVQEGDKGLYQFHGIETTVKKNQDSSFTFIGARFMNGQAIDPNKFYTGVASDFIVGGGDDFSKVINKIYTPRNVVVLGEYRNSIRGELIDMKVIKKGSLIDPNHPRIIIL